MSWPRLESSLCSALLSLFLAVCLWESLRATLKPDSISLSLSNKQLLWLLTVSPAEVILACLNKRHSHSLKPSNIWHFLLKNNLRWINYQNSCGIISSTLQHLRHFAFSLGSHKPVNLSTVCVFSLRPRWHEHKFIDRSCQGVCQLVEAMKDQEMGCGTCTVQHTHTDHIHMIVLYLASIQEKFPFWKVSVEIKALYHQLSSQVSSLTPNIHLYLEEMWKKHHFLDLFSKDKDVCSTSAFTDYSAPARLHLNVQPWSLFHFHCMQLMWQFFY